MLTWKSGVVGKSGLRASYQKEMIQIIIKLVPSQKDKIIFLMLIKHIFENINHGINCLRVSHLLSKYYLSKLAVKLGVFGCTESPEAGGFNGNYTDVILECSFISF